MYEVFGVPLKGHRRHDCSTNYLSLFSFYLVVCFFFSCVLKYSKQYFILQDHHVFLAEPTKPALVTRRRQRTNNQNHYCHLADNKSYPSWRYKNNLWTCVMVAQISFQFMIHKNMNWMGGRKTNGLVRINMVFLQASSSVCKLSSPALGFLSPKAQ